MSKKLMTLLLLSALLLGTACGNGGTPTDTDNQTSSGDQPEESTSSLSYIDKLETKDFGGYEFNICTEGAFDNFYVEEADGDVINDSVFKRNSEVEQRYNIKLNFENIEWKTAPDTIQQNVLAGDKGVRSLDSDPPVSRKHAHRRISSRLAGCQHRRSLEPVLHSGGG